MTQQKKILFICGSMNITTQRHQIAQALPEYAHYFTSFYVDGFLALLNKLMRVEKHLSYCERSAFQAVDGTLPQPRELQHRGGMRLDC